MTELSKLERNAWDFDFHQAMRRLECAFPEYPRAGEAHSPTSEPVRLGQDPSLEFAPAAIQAFLAPSNGKPGQLRVAFLGLFGPQGPLPQHFTEQAQEATRSGNDRALAAFIDLFHHRMLLLFHRAWTVNHPAACEDRPSSNGFSRYLAALSGLQEADASSATIPRKALLQFAARFMQPARNAEGLEALVGEYFECNVNVQEYIAEWLEIPVAQRWKLGSCPELSTLGQSTLPGGRVLQSGQKFRIELGPLHHSDYQRFLPGTPGLEKLTELVRSYVGPELAWDVRLILHAAERPPLRLGRTGRLGRDAWLGKEPHEHRANKDLIINPAAAAAVPPPSTN